MKIDVAAEVAACLKNAPGGNSTIEQVKAWLFDSRNGVAVRMSRIVEDETARDLLTEKAGRSWRDCTASDSEPQKLWLDLGASFGRIAAEDDRASIQFGPFPEDPKDEIFALNLSPLVLLDRSWTVRTLANECCDFCAAPLLTPSDLICPFPQLSLPYYAAVRQWQDNPLATGFYCNLQQVTIGDFIPASVILRLRLLMKIRFILRSEWTGYDDELDRKKKEFAARLNAIHRQLWATPDAEMREGAMGLVQVYLAGANPTGSHMMGYEADWSILPAYVPRELDVDLDHPKDGKRRLEALGLPPAFDGRWGRMRYVVQEAIKTHPSDVVSTTTRGLELLRDWWLAIKAGVLKSMPVGDIGVAPEVESSPWANLPNEPITLDRFMARFCETRSRDVRRYRRKALLAAARKKKNRRVTMPPLVKPHESGQSNKYFTHDLLSAWQGFIDENVHLPPLLAEYNIDGNVTGG